MKRSSRCSRTSARPRSDAPTSYAGLDEAEVLDEGDPVALGRDNAALREMLPSVRLLGGCWRTDHRHVAEIISAWDNP